VHDCGDQDDEVLQMQIIQNSLSIIFKHIQTSSYKKTSWGLAVPSSFQDGAG
jgi:hypothetical protein